ncbi:AmmeMemoRadiSam system protein B [Candidatus Bipolaricaulota bacterium]|nr:AmmeMemoRadiSam system protein B [Candidatus Bipolaricaulota bacterium]
MVRKPAWAIKILLVDRLVRKYNAYMAMRIRHPIVAGAFYPREVGRLRQLVAELLDVPPDLRGGPLRAPVGLISPHAGYPYSGATAAVGFRQVAALGAPDLAIVLGASHTGLGPAIALDDHEAWETPLGVLPVDGQAVSRLCGGGLSIDGAPFLREHSIEVQLPFIQGLWPEGVSIVPICVHPGPLGELSTAARAIAELVSDRSALILASSDFTHYESAETATRLDRRALEYIVAMDAEAFLNHVKASRLTICGAGAITLLMLACVQLGLGTAELIQYTTSGETTGDFSSVVGYASVLFSGGNHD